MQQRLSTILNSYINALSELEDSYNFPAREEMENNWYEDEETWKNPEDAPKLPAENDPHWPQDILTGI